MSLSYSTMIAELQLGRLRGKIFDVTWDSSYPTGGEPISNAAVGLQNIVGTQLVGAKDATSAGIVPALVASTVKMLAMRCAGSGASLIEVTAAVDLSAVTHRVMFLGN